jgi:cytochrome c peroxidase
VKRGETAFTAQEQQGYILYQNYCSSCHQEPLFSKYQFANNGLKPDSILKDKGRANITQRAEDSFKFKIPTLRNIEYSFPYMHDGRFKTLRQVLNHYTDGIQFSNTLDETLRKPIPLTSNQKVDLIAFLLTLSDKEFLFNPAHQYPKELFGIMPK